MSWLLISGTTAIEYRLYAPDELQDDRGIWEEVDSGDPRIAQIGNAVAQWGAFRMSVLNKEEEHGQQFHAALAIFMATDPITTNALMTEAGKDIPYTAYLRFAWNTLANKAQYVPPDGAVDAWNAEARQFNVPLEWLPSGRLVDQP